MQAQCGWLRPLRPLECCSKSSSAELPSGAVRAAPRTAGAPRPTAEHFERHRGIAGSLYAARNDLHREGIYKLGYTTGALEDRLRLMNADFGQIAHAGTFRSVAVVPVSSTYDDEQTLFALLAQYRISGGREFFMLPIGYVTEVMALVGKHGPSAREHMGELGCPPPPVLEDDLALVRLSHVPSALHRENEAGGWVVILRNEAYRPGIYRLGHTSTNLLDYKARLDAEQRPHTSHIGFFSIVHATYCASPRVVYEQVLAEPGLVRLGRTTFFDTALDRLTAMIRRHAMSSAPVALVAPVVPSPAEPTPPQGHPERSHRKSVSTQESPAGPRARPPPGESWFENTCPYSQCMQTVRAFGEPGTTGVLRCSECRRRVGFQIVVGSLLDVWRD